MSFASRNDRVGQLWGGDLQRRKPILGVMSSRMGPRCRKGSRFSGAANNANWFSASAVWPSRTRALAQRLYFWGNKGYTTVFFISGSNCFFPFEKSHVSRVHSSEPFSQTSDFGNPIFRGILSHQNCFLVLTESSIRRFLLRILSKCFWEFSLAGVCVSGLRHCCVVALHCRAAAHYFRNVL